jgi:hypothetical protein
MMRSAILLLCLWVSAVSADTVRLRRNRRVFQVDKTAASHGETSLSSSAAAHLSTADFLANLWDSTDGLRAVAVESPREGHDKRADRFLGSYTSSKGKGKGGSKSGSKGKGKGGSKSVKASKGKGKGGSKSKKASKGKGKGGSKSKKASKGKGKGGSKSKKASKGKGKGGSKSKKASKGKGKGGSKGGKGASKKRSEGGSKKGSKLAPSEEHHDMSMSMHYLFF